MSGKFWLVYLLPDKIISFMRNIFWRAINKFHLSTFFTKKAKISITSNFSMFFNTMVDQPIFIKVSYGSKSY